MSYALKYKAEFDSIAEESYSIEIHKKNYVGSVTSVITSAVPVVHQWQEDDPRAAIKGSNVTVRLINDGTLPITTFYSTNDDEYKIIIYWGTQKLFEGFVVQDDCSEQLRDDTHEISLSANDGLGLLKEARINENFLSSALAISVSGTANTLTFSSPTVDVYIGNRLRVVNTTVTPNVELGTYTVTAVDSTKQIITTRETIPTFASGSYLTGVYGNLKGRVTLISLVGSCLRSTGLELATNIFANIKEVNQNTATSFFSQTYIDSETFLDDKDYKNCYDVLTYILGRFKCTLFQALGEWYLIRWDEYRYYKNTVWGGFKHDKDMAFGSSTTYANAYVIGVTESYLTHSIFRPYKHVKETFDYKQRAGILRNGNLRTLGTFIGQSVEGDILRKDYTLADITNTRVNTAFIRVEYDSTLLIEKQRYIYAPQHAVNFLEGGFVYVSTIQFQDIEVNKNDRFDFSVEYRAHSDSNFQSTFFVYIMLYVNSTDRYYLSYRNGNLSWEYNSPSTYIPPNQPMAGSEDLSEWRTFSLTGIDSIGKPIKFPADGKLRIEVAGQNYTPANKDSLMKGFRLDYYAYINDSTQLIGHTHKTLQDLTIKNKYEEDIFIDDSPRNSLSGALFLGTFNGLLQNRTTVWNRVGVTESRRLGDIITFEESFWRRIQRSKMEGNIIGLVKTGKHLSILSALTHPHFTTENFAPGSMEIDYKNNNVRAVAWELFKDGEVDADLTKTYQFEYIYDNN